jgi:uncharacterized membrane protein YfcA
VTGLSGPLTPKSTHTFPGRPIIILVSSIAEAGFGFGGGLLAIPLLSLVVDLHASVTLFLVFQTLKGALLFIGFRWIAWDKIWLVTAVLPLGAWLGLSSLDYFDSKLLGTVLGVYLIGYVLIQYMPAGDLGAVARLVGIEVGVVSEVSNLESPSVSALGRRLRHEESYHAA